MSWHDLIGLVGVALVLLAYLGVQTGRLRVEARRYSLMNALGAGGILISLSVDFNLSAFLIEAAWLVISLYGLARAWRRKQRSS